MTYRDYLKVEDIDDFLKIAEKCDVILRIDPFLIVNFYGTMFYIDLGEIEEDMVKRVISGLKAKIVNIRQTKSYKSVSEFYLKETQA